MSKVLLIEDEVSLASALQRVLESDGHEVRTATDGAGGLSAAREGDFQVVVTDLKMPGEVSGMDVIKSLHDTRPHLPVILMTGHHTTEAAIEAMKIGAYDYIVKPPDPADFLGLVEKAAANNRLMAEPVALGEAAHGKDAIIGTSRSMTEVYKQIGRVAAMPVTVLIRGETGTGKELVARAIHQHSLRDQQPFIEVNCAAIPENLLESELFGHEAGAFTDAKTRRIGRFEQANKGTILLDEIGDMSMGTQVKLLRVLQNKRIQRLGGKDMIDVDVRVLAATHRDLELAMEEKQFREDLYHRLNDAVINLPPLRDRSEDIPELINFFIRRYAADFGAPATSMPGSDAIIFLQQQRWPGNVRELRNVLRKALLLARGYNITKDIVVSALAQIRLPKPSANQNISAWVLDLLTKAKAGEIQDVHTVLLEAVERELYGQAISMAHGDQSKACAWLGVSRPTMRDKLMKFGLHPSQTET